jgi:uncharacterized protein
VTVEAFDGIQRVEDRIRGYARPAALVAFSGGVDSAVVLALAARTLGHHSVTAITAISPSYPAGELEQAEAVARVIGVQHRTVATDEVANDAYARNDALRCFHCKGELYRVLRRLAAEAVGPDVVILAGANADDATEFRPGLLAAERDGVRNPLLEERIGKPLVRSIARQLGLVVADKPALACLSSRVAYGIRVTPDLLARIDQAEAGLRDLGYRDVRARHLGDALAIQVPAPDIESLLAHPGLPALIGRLHDLGWLHVTIDPEGLRHGSMNAGLKVSPATQRALQRVTV